MSYSSAYRLSESRARLAIFAAPKPFRGHVGTIQKNAIQSWKQLDVAQEIFLLGSEEGIADAARLVGATHCNSLRLDSYGTPLVSDVFDVAGKLASTAWLCYVNSDIILMPEFGRAVSRALAEFEECLVVSRRWNLDIREDIDFRSGWQERLRARASIHAELFTAYGIDVFVFPKGLFTSMPSFSLGRPYWDSWMIWNARQRGYPVVDVTQSFGVIHQNHSYDGFGSTEEIRRSQQGLRNFWLAGNSYFELGRTDDATHFIKDLEVAESDTRTVSVVIPHAGTLSQLRGCLRALSQQSYPRSYIEIIVVENSDKALSAAAEFEFPFIKLTRELKRGPAAARNKGAALAQGEIIAFLDSDCLPVGNWIENGVLAAAKHALECVVACEIRPGDNRSGVAGVRGYEALVYHDQKGYVEEAKACITGGMFVPKNVWIKVGPFDEGFPEAACEDWEWSTRASSLGVGIVYSAEASVTHPVHSTWSELRAKSRRLVRGELILARKRRRYRVLNFDYQLVAYSRRLRGELALIMAKKRARLSVKFSVALAAIAVWFWSVTEVRKQLFSVPRVRIPEKFARRLPQKHDLGVKTKGKAIA